MKKPKHPILFCLFLLLSIAWAVFIFCRSAQPASSSSEESGRLLTFLQQFFPWLTVFLIRKAAHLTEFFILGAFVSCAVRAAGKNIPWFAMGAELLVAVTDELIQLTQDGRSCELRDILIDFAGAVLAAVVFWLIFRIYDKKKKASS